VRGQILPAEEAGGVPALERPQARVRTLGRPGRLWRLVAVLYLDHALEQRGERAKLGPRRVQVAAVPRTLTHQFRQPVSGIAEHPGELAHLLAQLSQPARDLRIGGQRRLNGSDLAQDGGHFRAQSRALLAIGLQPGPDLLGQVAGLIPLSRAGQHGREVPAAEAPELVEQYRHFREPGSGGGNERSERRRGQERRQNRRALSGQLPTFTDRISDPRAHPARNIVIPGLCWHYFRLPWHDSSRSLNK